MTLQNRNFAFQLERQAIEITQIERKLKARSRLSWCVHGESEEVQQFVIHTKGGTLPV